MSLSPARFIPNRFPASLCAKRASAALLNGNPIPLLLTFLLFPVFPAVVVVPPAAAEVLLDHAINVALEKKGSGLNGEYSPIRHTIHTS